jgi:long-chain acyl-CoA synthetase
MLVTAGGKNVAPQPIEARLATSPYIAQAVAIGDNLPYITALITPNYEQLQAYFEEQKINGKSKEELAAHPATEALVAGAVKELNGDLAAYERIRRFTILSAEFSLESGELTPTLKVKRKVVTERYRRQIEEMYLKTHRTTDYGLDA